MNSFENFKKKQEIGRFAENTKMAVVGVTLLSVIVFTFLGKETVKPYIWYWVGFMVLLLVICAVQDLINHNKIKKLGL